MKFVIEGADAKSGGDRRIEVDAADEQQALLQAKAAGVWPTSVDNTPPELSETKQVEKPASPPFHVLLLHVATAVATVALQPAGCLSILILVGIFYVALNRGGTGDSSSVQPVFVAGQPCTVFVDCFAARDEATFERAWRVGKNDRRALAMMIARGEVIDVPEGTRVIVVTTNLIPGNAKVRIEGSPDEIWLSAAWLAD